MQRTRFGRDGVHWQIVRRLSAMVALFVFAVATNAADAPALRSGAFNPPRVAPEFSLRGSDGSELKLSRYRGKVVALGFGYSFCPDICPTTLAYLAKAKEKLGAAGKDFQVIYVTVDPERDSPERLRAYLAGFDPTFVGATGATADLAEVRKQYGIQVSKQPPSAGNPSMYFIHHSSFVYLIDRAGSLRSLVPYGTSIDDMAHDVKALLGK
jgi:protein SCO1